MVKTIVKVEGMKCPMCEKHMCEAVSKAMDVKNVTASHKEKECVIVSEKEPEKEMLEELVKNAGYVPGEITFEKYEKKGLFGRK